LFTLNYYSFIPIILLITILAIRSNNYKETIFIFNKGLDKAIKIFFTVNNLRNLLLQFFFFFILSIGLNLEVLVVVNYYFSILSVCNLLQGLFVICYAKDLNSKTCTFIFRDQILILLNRSFCIFVIKGFLRTIGLFYMNDGKETTNTGVSEESVSQNNSENVPEPNPGSSDSNVDLNPSEDVLLSRIKAQVSLPSSIRIQHVYTQSNAPGSKNFVLDTAELRNELGRRWMASGETTYQVSIVSSIRSPHYGELRVHSSGNRKIFIKPSNYLIRVLENNR
jgi:hypothetical protein